MIRGAFTAAVVLCLLLGLGLWLRHRRAGLERQAAAPKGHVICYIHDMLAGEVLAEADLGVRGMPRGPLSNEFRREQATAVIGQKLAVDVRTTEPVKRHHLVAPPAGGPVVK